MHFFAFHCAGVTDIYQEIFGKPNPNQGLEQHTGD